MPKLKLIAMLEDANAASLQIKVCQLIEAVNGLIDAAPNVQADEPALTPAAEHASTQFSAARAQAAATQEAVNAAVKAAMADFQIQLDATRAALAAEQAKNGGK